MRSDAQLLPIALVDFVVSKVSKSDGRERSLQRRARCLLKTKKMPPKFGNTHIGAKATVKIQGHPDYGQWVGKPSTR